MPSKHPHANIVAASPHFIWPSLPSYSEFRRMDTNIIVTLLSGSKALELQGTGCTQIFAPVYWPHHDIISTYSALSGTIVRTTGSYHEAP